MIKFTKTGIFCLLIVIQFCLFQIFIHQYSIQTKLKEDIMEARIIDDMPVVQAKEEIKIWQIEIPQISLIANIVEGTKKENLSQYVCHFEKSSIKQGNVCLATSNKDIKLLKEGDEIKYRADEFEKTYIIEKSRIIKDTEWEFLAENEENMLTLITYIENQSEYRRCIIAVEKVV